MWSAPLRYRMVGFGNSLKAAPKLLDHAVTPVTYLAVKPPPSFPDSCLGDCRDGHRCAVQRNLLWSLAKWLNTLPFPRYQLLVFWYTRDQKLISPSWTNYYIYRYLYLYMYNNCSKINTLKNTTPSCLWYTQRDKDAWQNVCYRNIIYTEFYFVLPPFIRLWIANGNKKRSKVVHLVRVLPTRPLEEIRRYSLKASVQKVYNSNWYFHTK